MLDLAAFVLNQNGAKWDKKFTFGRKIDPKRECVYPGDIMQFEGVKVKYTRGLTVYTETMDHHTAVIMKLRRKAFLFLPIRIPEHQAGRLDSVTLI